MMGSVPSIRFIKAIEGNIIAMNKAKSKTLSLNVNEQQVYESLPFNEKSTSEP